MGVETVGSLLRILKDHSHHGFPVVGAGGQFVGMLKRESLLQLLWRGADYGCFQDPAPSGLRRPAPVIPYTDERHNTSLRQIEKAIPRSDLAKQIDLHPYVNEGCYTVPKHAALTRVYQLFRDMGLRHLPVLNRNGDACGIITRKDLILAH